MLLEGFPAEVFATNCYVIATGVGEECLIVDPGIGVLDQLAGVLEKHKLRPAAVLATHGHVDHIYSVTPVCGTHDAALYIHGDDTYRVTDPYGTLSPELRAMLEAQFGDASSWKEPSDVRTFSHGDILNLAGLELQVLHAPGHTEGSVMFQLPESPESLVTTGRAQVEVNKTLLSGDVLFRGSIGRTDLPGGNHQQMMTSLRDVVLPLSDDTLVLPGHGPATTMQMERHTNPYLMDL